MDEKKIIKNLSAVGIIGNVVLFLFKFYAGIVGKSEAMISDAVHSLSDIFATIVALIGVKLSKKAPDKDHPYGHERFECLASMILGLILVATGVGIGFNGVKTIIAGNYDKIETPNAIALIAAIVSIIVKESMFWYTMHYAKKLDSSAFIADAWHHRSDALSSIGSLIGIAGAMLGFPVLDSVACVGICLCILKVGYDILKDAVVKMLDTSCGKDFEQEVAEFIKQQPGVIRMDVLHTRKFGNKKYIDVEIAVDETISLIEAHDISEAVHDEIEKKYEDVKHVMIHVNPISKQ